MNAVDVFLWIIIGASIALAAGLLFGLVAWNAQMRRRR